jgi:hypothetical protein
MPSILCPCGSIIDLAKMPHPDGFSLLAETRLEELADSVEALHKEAIAVSAFMKGLYLLLSPVSPPSPHIYQCQTCGRLAVFKHPSESAVSQWYLPESGGEKPLPRLRSLWDEESSESSQASG